MNTLQSKSAMLSMCLWLACVFAAVAQEEKTVTAVVKVKTDREIASAVSGVIESSMLTEGAVVREDDLLFTIDGKQAELELVRLKREYELSKKEAESEVDILYAEKSKKVAQSELRRAKEANAKLPGAVSTTEMEKLTLLVEKAMAEKEKAVFQRAMKNMHSNVKHAEYEIGQQKLQRHKVHSPIAGKVVQVLKKEGEWVTESEVVAKLVLLDKLIVEVKLQAEDALGQLEQRTATFAPEKKLRLPSNETFELKLLFVHPEVNPVNNLVKVWYELDNRKMLLVPGISGTVTVGGSLNGQIAETSDE